MDSNPLERERGITILSKNCAVTYTPADGPYAGEPIRINIIDTPGHADFGGEVERVLRMADGCLLLVDAFEGPMPQTKFVLTKALELGLRPVVVVNKCDRPDARADEVVNEVFDLLVALGADDLALDFPVVYASARQGWAATDASGAGYEPLAPGDHGNGTLRPIFDAIVEHVPPPHADSDKPLQMLITTLDYNDYVGRIGIGRVFAGHIESGQPVALLKRDGSRSNARIGRLIRFTGLGREETDRVEAGDLCGVVGVEGVDIGDTVADPENGVALPTVKVDEPTMSLLVRINDSPFGGQDGRFVTSRQIKARLDKELEHNVALRVAQGKTADEFVISGRGILHLGILLENMRREGFELSIGRPQVILREIDGVTCEPVETLVIDTPNDTVGRVMELVGGRKAELKKMESRGPDITHLVFDIPSRALIGLRSRVLTASAGEAIMNHRFDRYDPVPPTGFESHRAQGVMIATEGGQVTAHAVEGLHERGFLFVKPTDKVYTGQIVGEHNRDSDIPVNICRLKQLTNIRNANKEATVTLKAPRTLSLEEALEYIDDDEYVELTPGAVRLRKKILDEGARRRSERMAKDKQRTE
jgi:GTP-binding protein